MKFDVGREHKDLQEYLKRLKGLDSKHMRFEAERSLEKLKVELNKRNNAYDIYNDKLLELYMGIGKYNKINHLTNTFNNLNNINNISSEEYENSKKYNLDYLNYDNKVKSVFKPNSISNSQVFNQEDNENKYNLGNSQMDHILKNETELIYINEMNKNSNNYNDPMNLGVSNSNVNPKLDSESVFMTNYQSNSVANSINANPNSKISNNVMNSNTNVEINNSDYESLLNDLNSIKKLNNNVNKRGLEMKVQFMEAYNNNQHSNANVVNNSGNDKKLLNDSKNQDTLIKDEVKNNDVIEVSKNENLHSSKANDDLKENIKDENKEELKTEILESDKKKNEEKDQNANDEKETIKNNEESKELKEDGGSSKKYLFTGESNKSIK